MNLLATPDAVQLDSGITVYAVIESVLADVPMDKHCVQDKPYSKASGPRARECLR
jgi:hypothetical protein